MKNIIVILLLIVPFNSFCKKFNFSVSSGINTNFFSTIEETEKNNISSTTGFYSVYYNTLETQFEPKLGTGFFIDGSMSYSLNNYFSVETGIGISSNPTTLLSTSTDSEGMIFVGEFNNNGNLVLIPFKLQKEIKFKILLLNIPVCVNLELFKQRIIISAGTEVSKVLRDCYEIN